MRKIVLFLLLALARTSFAQTASVQVDANGTVLNFQSPSTKTVNFPTGKLTVNGVQITGLESDASTTVKGVTKLSLAPVSSTNPIAVGDNDSRNTNARTPTAHASTHANAGSDPITLIISQITGLQSALDLKAPLASPTFTGVPLAPTAAVDTNTTQVATTAFVLAQAANATPIVASTGAVGTSTRYARQDHIHPAQTSVTGNAATATALQTARTINGTSFDGTTNITVTAAAGTLTGATLASGITASSLLSASGGSFGTAAFTASSAYATASQGVTTLSLATPNVLYTTPVTFSNSSGAWTGTLALNTQTANTVFAGPTTGSAATPTMRALVLADLPSITSANLRSLLSDENGTGVALFDGATSATFITPALGTPSALVLTNATGSPTGISLTKAQLNTIVSDDDPAYLGTTNAFTAAQSLTLSNAQAQTNTITGLGTTTLPGLQVTNTTAAAAGAQQYSPSIRWSGKGWKTDAAAASQGVDFRAYVVPVQGAANPTGLLQFESSINGAAFTNPITFGSDGTIRQYSGTTNYTGFSTDGFIVSFIQNGSTKASLNNSGDFGATTFYINGDTFLRRNAAGVFEITGGTAGQWGSLKLGTRDSGTNTITNGLTLGHQSTGTPAAGLGEAILFNLDSSTTADQNAGRVTSYWSTATHATRTSVIGFETVNSGTLAEKWNIQGAGHLLATTDNSYDIGASGASRPRNTFLAGDITNAGNEFLGVGTSALWSSSYRGLRIGSSALFSDNNASAGSTFIFANNANQSSGSWLYGVSDFATRYYQFSGTHVFSIAQSGTAGNAITWVDKLSISPTGVVVSGTTTNDNAAAGNVGEYISASVVVGSALALTTATPKTVTSISLTAGDWDVTAIGALTGASTGTEFDVAIGTTTNSLTGTVLGNTRCQTPTVSLTGADASLMVPAVRVSISSTTTYYLIVQETFTVGAPGAYGRISARRVR